jgi:hypothetical protein
MVLPRNDASNLIEEVARQASQSKDKSLFSLLLLLEEQLCGNAFESEVGKSETSSLLAPRPRFAIVSRYVE